VERQTDRWLGTVAQGAFLDLESFTGILVQINRVALRLDIPGSTVDDERILLERVIAFGFAVPGGPL
jgi:hypothetical protein